MNPDDMGTTLAGGGSVVLQRAALMLAILDYRRYRKGDSNA